LTVPHLYGMMKIRRETSTAPRQMKSLTYTRLRVLQSIVRTGQPPTRTRVSTLAAMKDAGLIGPMEGAEPWRITKAGLKAMDKAEAEEACQMLGRKLAEFF